MATIAEAHRVIRKALLGSHFKFIDASDYASNRRIYTIPKSLLEFEVMIDRFNPETREFDLIKLRWCYIGPGWKFIEMTEVFDYNLPEEFKQFLIFNLDLFSKELISIDDFIEALERVDA